MSEFKGTPGPWFVEDDRWTDGDTANITSDYRSENSMLPIAQVCGGGSESGFDGIFSLEQKYNAKLMASAPELLESLHEMVAIVKKNSYPCPDKPNSNYARAEAAEVVIAKALGK
ncbi:hypothetical protein NFJ01_04175 [Lelliottia amnigena]|uniref:hypothetical protein n=1 Tax=Lelliottia amnigena TaxID=61646 RepID=UPI002091C93B|nr:hypothetical protein [Lelliottia amnigena]USR61592.1 hypothetical protein NFJ01_04175 [Lelliottia amnigena]